MSVFVTGTHDKEAIIANRIACKNTFPHKIKNTGYKITAGASI
jgi:hypothetical protein